VEFSTHRFRSGDDIELEAWYIPRKDSRGLALLFHGYATSKSCLLSVARAFHDIGFSTFLIDFRGSGGSDGDCTSVGLLEALDVVKAVEYARGISQDKSVVLYGQSMGGAAIFRAISGHGLKTDFVIIEGVFDTMLSTVKARFSAMGVPAFPSAHLLTFWGGWQTGHSAFKHNPVDYARDVRCPTIVLHGDEDPRATIEQANAIFRNLAGPKHFERFSGVGHSSCHDAAPEKWKQAVSDFLNS
jgi:pimeloyl-ACP methyl ester carboxylesterase